MALISAGSVSDHPTEMQCPCTRGALLFSHVFVGVTDFDRALAFYRALADPALTRWFVRILYSSG